MFNEDVLDFIKIKEELASHCSSIIAKEMALALEPMTNREKIQEDLDETAEALRSWQTEIEQPLGELEIYVNLVKRVVRILCFHEKPYGMSI